MSAPPKKPSGKSPYAKYAKAPFQYSDIHARWLRAAKAGHDAEARAIGKEHLARFLPDRLRLPKELWT